MSTQNIGLAELVSHRREQLGMSLRDVEAASEGLVSKTHLGAIERGEYPSQRGDRVLRGLSLALELPIETVYKAAGRSAKKMPPFVLPEKAQQLNVRERKVVLAMIDALLLARDGR